MLLMQQRYVLYDEYPHVPVSPSYDFYNVEKIVVLLQLSNHIGMLGEETNARNKCQHLVVSLPQQCYRKTKDVKSGHLSYGANHNSPSDQSASSLIHYVVST